MTVDLTLIMKWRTASSRKHSLWQTTCTGFPQTRVRNDEARPWFERQSKAEGVPYL